MSTPFKFPVSNPVHAMKVTNIDYQVDIFEEELYTNFDSIRPTNTVEDIMVNLGILQNKLVVTNEYEYILVSGHRGCGKSSELRRLHQNINQPHLFTSIFISIEEEFNLGDFTQEKFYFTIFSKLLERMEEEGIETKVSALKDLIEMLMQDRVSEKIISNNLGAEIGVEKGGGFDLLGILKAKGEVKAKLAHDRAFTEKITQNIRLNIFDFLGKINLLLIDIRQALIEKNKGRDIVFIIDGSEKIPLEAYKKTFVDNFSTLKILNSNIIVCLSIDTCYAIENSAFGFKGRYLLPMLSMSDEFAYLALMKEALGKRIDINDLFESDGVLFYLLRNAAGCIRQMYLLVNLALIAARGEKINLKYAEEAVCKEGKRLYEQLSVETYSILKKIDSTDESTYYGEPNISKLLFGLQLLKYNGNSMVNPIIKEYMRIEKNEYFA